MKKIDLNVDIREDSGKGQSHSLRRNNYIPGILYNEASGVLLKIDENELSNLITKNGEHIVVKLNIQGQETPALIREIQRDTITNRLVHIDFKPIALHEIIHAEIPILVLNGERIEKNGWVINRQLSTVEVEGEVENIPPSITLDVSQYKSGDVLKVADLEISRELSIVSDNNEVILSILQPKQASEPAKSEEKQFSNTQI